MYSHEHTCTNLTLLSGGLWVLESRRKESLTDGFKHLDCNAVQIKKKKGFNRVASYLDKMQFSNGTTSEWNSTHDNR